jgi:hypothetical protein
MPGFNQIAANLPVDNKRVEMVKNEDQTTNKIIKYIKLEHGRSAKDYDVICQSFWAGDPRSTARNIFNFLKKNVHYRIEPENDQTVKTPGRIMADGHGDCKHYSLFTVGVCDALARAGYPVAAHFRFVADRPNLDVHHVFAVVVDPATKKEIWTDPVLDTFDIKPKFFNTTDMAISRLSGLGAASERSRAYNDNNNPYYTGMDYMPMVGKTNLLKQFAHSMEVNFSNIKKGANYAVKDIAHGMAVNTQNLNKAAKNVAHGMEVNAKNFAHGMEVNAKNFAHGMDVNFQNAKAAAIKVGGMPARKAYLGLVALNIMGLANKLYNSSQDPILGAKMYAKWKEIGGDPKVLNQAIYNGHKRKRIGECIGLFGVDDATIAAWITLASTILLIMKEFNKSTPGNQPPSSKDLQDQQQFATQTKEGAANLLANAYTAATIATDDSIPANIKMQQAAALDNLVKSNTGSSMDIIPGITDQGTPQITVNDVAHPALNAAVSTSDDIAGPTGTGEHWYDGPFNWVKNNPVKAGGIAVGAGLVIYFFGPGGHKRRKR